MIFFYEIPIFLILVVVLGLLGMDISGIIKWIMIIGGIITAVFGICSGLDPWDKAERIASILIIIIGVIMVILGIYIGSLGSFHLYDILDWIF